MVATEKRVLVVDDEAIMCESYRRALEDAGYSVSTARSGRDAIAACRSQPFDVMIADLKMPDMDGLEVTRVVKKEFPRVRVVIVTGYPTQQSSEEAQGLGVFDYLCKPLTPEQLSFSTAAAMASPPRYSAPPAPEKAPTAEEADELARSSAPSVQPMEAGPMDARPMEVGLMDAKSEAALALAPMDLVKTLGLIVAGPLIGLAYVMFLPIIGFGMLLSVTGERLAKAVGLGRG